MTERPISKAEVIASLHAAEDAVVEAPPPWKTVQVEHDRAMAFSRARAWATLVPKKFRTAMLTEVEPAPVRDVIRRWGEQPEGRNLVLLGPVGSGKSHAATAAVRAMHFEGDRIEWWPTVELLDAMRPGSDDDDAMARALGADVLLLDDLGAERPTAWTAERLYLVVNRRWMEDQPIVATSNLTLDELRQALGDRCFSRLTGGADVVTLTGRDRRRG